MSTTPFMAVITDGLSHLQDVFVAFLPHILAAAILLAMLSGFVWWITKGKAGKIIKKGGKYPWMFP